MKLEYLHDLTEGGLFKQVVSENLVRLFDFDEAETSRLCSLIQLEVLEKGKTFHLSDVDFVDSTNIQLQLELVEDDEGIVWLECPDILVCRLGRDGYKVLLDRMKSSGTDHQWLCETSIVNIDFLYSSGGSW